MYDWSHFNLLEEQIIYLSVFMVSTGHLIDFTDSMQELYTFMSF